MIYRRKELDNVFAIKGFYSYEEHQPKKTIEGAIEFKGKKFRYRINGASVSFAEGEAEFQDSGKELYDDEWLIINPAFNWNDLAMHTIYDDEFQRTFVKSTSKDIKILDASTKGIERKKYDIQMDFQINDTDNHSHLWPTNIIINGEKPSKSLLFNLGRQIMECSRPDDWGEEPSKEKAKITKKVRHGFVYLMIDKNTGYHKIGFSINPKHREKTLQSEKPTIELLHKFKGTMQKEKELHNKYDPKRIRGEWFNLTKKDIDYIKTL